MATTRRRRRRHPAPSNFEGIGLGERMRWISGTISIEGEFTPVKHPGGIPILPWPSWESWAQTYHACRRAFLEWYAIRHPGQEPGSEALYGAYLNGSDPGAVVIDRRPDLRQEPYGGIR